MSFCLNYQDAVVTPPPHESCLSSGAAMGSKYISFKLEKLCSHSYSGARKEFCIEMCLKHSHMTKHTVFACAFVRMLLKSHKMLWSPGLHVWRMSGNDWTL